ncbi:MAG: hypothetical protein ACTS10_13575 [Kiloniellales bacterium]
MPVPLPLLFAVCLALTPPLVLLSDLLLGGVDVRQVFSLEGLSATTVPATTASQTHEAPNAWPP